MNLHALPADSPQRLDLHNEVHARPQARIRTPALVLYVAVFNEGIDRETELKHLQLLPGQQDLSLDLLQGNFLRIGFDDYSLKWERHNEFTRYSLVLPLSQDAVPGIRDSELLQLLPVPDGWLAGIPGQTIAAIQLFLLHGDLSRQEEILQLAQPWFGDHPIIASVMGRNNHSCVLTDLRVRPDGFERMLVISSADMAPTRAGRVSQRLLELETYRLMALRGLPVAKELAPMLAQCERDLATITSSLESKGAADHELLDALVALSAQVERAIARQTYRFAATRAYHAIVVQRTAELRESPFFGAQTLGEFLQRRLSPAMATVAATEQRLTSLSERVARASALLRTRVDIAAEDQNLELLEKLTRGQELQLHLQTTVEGLSIAAISYYVVSLMTHLISGIELLGVPINPEAANIVLIPVVLIAVWANNRRIHKKVLLADKHGDL